MATPQIVAAAKAIEGLSLEDAAKLPAPKTPSAPFFSLACSLDFWWPFHFNYIFALLQHDACKLWSRMLALRLTPKREAARTA